MSRRRVALGVGANALDRVLIAAIQLLLVPILATHWGVERYGGWAMLMTMPALLAMGDLGFASASTVRMTMEVARGERDQARTTIRSATQIVAVACAFVLLLAGSFALFLPDHLILEVPHTSAAEMRMAIAALAGYACLIMFSALLQGVFRSNQRFALGTFLSTITTLLENGLLILVVFFNHGIAVAAVALLFGRSLGFAIMFVIAGMLRTWVLPSVFGGSAEVRRALLGPALAAMAIPLATALLLQGTVAALGFVAGAALVPAFVAARTLSRIGLQASQILTTALMPEFGAAAAVGRQRSVRRMFVTVLGTTSAIALPFALLLALAGPAIVRVWSNNQLDPPTGLMLAIAASALFGGIWNPLSNLMLAINRQAEFAIAYAILAACGVGFTVLFGKVLGNTAAAAALAIVDFAMLLIVGRFAIRYWGGRQSWEETSRELAGQVRSDMGRLIGRKESGR
ncbi:MAG: lipopolysaccharide biosynthesis protein [Sphingomonadaceae bacterium]|nr:lipopolysaccharide biosynthesis protein [Sphingomonadaceae bacterium]